MRYIKKPVEIEAFRLGHDSYPDWFTNHKDNLGVTSERHPNGRITAHIRTLEGTIYANRGDYIIKGVAGEIYPCRSDIFEATYEEVK